MDQVFNDIVVLDLSRYLPGPFATQLLRDMGAHVVKIESASSGGDPIRRFSPQEIDGNFVGFHSLNRGKDSIALDFRQEEDKTILLALLEKADILVESFRPGVLEVLLGREMEDISRLYPRLIVCRISACGQSGPDSSFPMHDLNASADAGILSMMSTPMNTPVPMADYATGYTAAFLCAAALRKREQDGYGTVLDIALSGCARALTTIAYPIADRFGNEVVENGNDPLAGGMPCYTVYPAAVGHVACGCLESHFWKNFCELLGVPHLSHRGFEFGKAADDVKAEVEHQLQRKTAEEWDHLFREHQLPVNAVRHLNQVSDAFPQIPVSERSDKKSRGDADITLSIPTSSESSTSLSTSRYSRSKPTSYSLRVPGNGLFADGKPIFVREPGPLLGCTSAYEFVHAKL